MDSPKSSQISEKSSALSNELERLDKLATVLCEKLGPVRASKPQSVRGAVKSASPEQPLAPLAGFLNESRSRAEKIGDVLECLLNEVEC